MKNKKLFVISIGGLAVMMLIGMVLMSMASSPEEVAGIDLNNGWFLYRAGLYMFVVSLWGPICHLLTWKSGHQEPNESDTDKNEADRSRDIYYLKSLRLKVFIAFLFFEIVLIQQLGL